MITIFARKKNILQTNINSKNKKKQNKKQYALLTLQIWQKMVRLTSNLFVSNVQTIASFLPASTSSIFSIKNWILSKIFSSNSYVVGFALFTFSWCVLKTSRNKRRFQLKSSIYVKKYMKIIKCWIQSNFPIGI